MGAGIFRASVGGRQILPQRPPTRADNARTRPARCLSCPHPAASATPRWWRGPLPATGETAMRIGVPREIKVHEYRVGLVPAGVRELTMGGHEVLVESGAGCGIGVDDAQYEACDARVLPSASQVF